MIVDLPHDIQHCIFDMYKSHMKERYESSHHYIVDILRASCGEMAGTLLAFIGNLLNNPLKKPHFALVLTGEGAIAISQLLCKIGGKYVHGDGRLLGRFNGHLKTANLLVIQDSPTESLVQKVKEIVSNPFIVIEERWQNPERVRSHHFVVLVSGYRIDDPARRFVNVECGRVGALETALNPQPIQDLIRHLAAV